MARKQKKTLKSVAEVIKALGGPKAIADWVGAPRQTVSNWKSFGYIPSPWFDLFEQRLDDRGYSVDRGVFGFKTDPLESAQRAA